MEVSCVYESNLFFRLYLLLLHFLMLCCCFAVVVAIIVYFECVDFVAFAAGIDVTAAHTLFVDCFLAFVEIVVVVVVAVDQVISSGS